MTTKDIRKITGNVFNIQKYSVHDGPGIRTVVFLKGCPMACQWCSNPESQSFAPELAYASNRCISLSECQRCSDVCPEDALMPGEDNKIAVNWQKCSNCLKCADACPAGALIVYGKDQNVKEVIDQVEKDAMFYARSGGGLTLGGGEPFAQPEFALALLKEAKKRYIKTAVETCGLASTDVILEACKYINMMMYDIKSMDSDKHKEFTKVGNEMVLENFKAIREAFPNLKIRVRTPVVPGFNDTAEDIQAIVDFIEGENVEYELLPYHRLGTQKYTNIGREYALGEVALDNTLFLELREAANKIGITVK